MNTLNENEIKVLKAATDNALDAAGGDFGFSDEISEYLPEFNDKQISGYISQLNSKGFLYLDDYETNESSGVQTTFPKEALQILLSSGAADQKYVESFQAWH